MYTDKIETCSQRIEKAMILRKMKQAELCKQANIPKSSLSLYLRGAYEPKQDRVYKMAMVLNVSETWLMGYDVPMERNELSSIAPIELIDNEKTMLDLFRRIPETQQRILIQILRDGLTARK